MELFTFGVILVAFFVSSRNELEVFHASRLQLNPTWGLVNTVFLLTSGYCMALSVRRFQRGEAGPARRLLESALVGGLLFVVLKGIEYASKLDQGLVLGHNTFFTYYWLSTCFHLMHVVVGLIILFNLRAHLVPSRVSTLKDEDYEAGAAFWHMCDLIWLILFPALYLVV